VLNKPGTPRKPEETVAKIKEQIKAACRGVATAVEVLQTESGVKDKIATHWIELIEKARAINQERVFNHDTRDARLNDSKIKGPAREKIKQEIIDKTQEELFAWVIIQPPDRYAELNDLTSMDLGSYFIEPMLILPQKRYPNYALGIITMFSFVSVVLTRIVTAPARSYTQFFLGRISMFGMRQAKSGMMNRVHCLQRGFSPPLSMD
jgi:hypothetical protein